MKKGKCHVCGKWKKVNETRDGRGLICPACRRVEVYHDETSWEWCHYCHDPKPKPVAGWFGPIGMRVAICHKHWKHHREMVRKGEVRE